ncbi:hypothetical protein ACQPX6_13835 [Actinomycetospora sp. CA-101289]|uniref:hypothetical protein n=1 Tax=Actinomycetospora sp. CA-101289 TaxID=3239893 RepID=UPI003D99271E
MLDRNGASMGAAITFSSDLGGVDADGGTLYVGTGDLNAPSDRARFDVLPLDSASWVVGEPIALGRASWFDAQDGTGWAAYPQTDEVRRIDLGTRAPSGDPITSVGASVGAMQVVGEELWVTNTQDSTVTRVYLEP